MQGAVVLWLLNYTCNIGVRALWSLGNSPVSLQPSGLVWRSDDNFMQGARRPLLCVKLHSEDGIKVTGKFSVSLRGLPFMES